MSYRQPNKQQPQNPSKNGSPAVQGPQQGQQQKQPFPSWVSMSQQQLQTLQYLQSQPSLLPQQQQILNQLQAQFRYMQQQQAQQRQQQLQQQQQQLQQRQQQDQNDLLNELQNKDLGSVSDKELEALISQQDIGSFAESLLKEMQADGGDISDADKDAEPEEKPQVVEAGMKVSSLDIPTEVETVKHAKHRQLKLHTGMSAKEIVRSCENIVASGARFNHCTSLLPESHPPPGPPENPPASLSKEQLLPPTPSVYLDNKKDAFSVKLQDFCLQNPITVVRGIAGALKLDLGLFSTKTLQEEFPDHKIEVKTQQKQSPDENVDLATLKPVWTCPATKSLSTLGKFAQYQTAMFQENLKGELEKPGSSAAEKEAARKQKLKAMSKPGSTTIKYASVVELSETQKFRQQHTELMKLPVWLRAVSAGNMLSHLGRQIPGGEHRPSSHESSMCQNSSASGTFQLLLHQH